MRGDRGSESLHPGVCMVPLRTAHCIALLLVCWLVLGYPWLSGTVTIPYDAKAHFHAQIQFLATALHSGQSPFWTPNVFAGSPQIADPQSLIFSPAILLAAFDAMPSFRSLDIYVLVMLGLGGLALFAFGRDRGWHPAACVLMALVFSFGGSAAWRIQHIGQIQSLAFLALTLWLLGRALDRRSIAYGALTGIAAGAMIVEPDQVAMLGCYLLAGFAIDRLLHLRAQQVPLRDAVLPMGAAGIFAFLVAALPLALAYLFVSSSERAAIPLAEAARGSLHPASLLTAFAADLYGAVDPRVEYWGPHSPVWDSSNLTLSQNMTEVYFGALPLVLLGLALWRRDLFWRRDVRFFAIALVAMVLYALGTYTPAFAPLHAFLPGVGAFRRPADATFLMGLAVAALAGGVLDGLLSRPRLAQPPAGSLRLAAMLGLVPAIGFAAAFGVAASEGMFATALRPVAAGAAWAALAVLAIVLCLRRPASALVATVGIAALVTLDLRINNGPNESTALPPAQYALLRSDAGSEMIAFLKANAREKLPSARRDRVELAGLGFDWPNAGLVHGFDHTLGYNPLRLADYATVTGAGDTIAGPDQRRFTPLFPSYRSVLADMLGLRFIATSIPLARIDPNAFSDGAIRLVRRMPEGFIYENRKALPRVLLVHAWSQVAFDEIIAAGRWPAFDPRRTVLLEDAPPGEVRLVAPHDGIEPKARLVRYENTLIEVDVDARAPGILVLNDVWHPWWKVEIDAMPAELLRANLLFRAVHVPAGRHSVRFTFAPLEGAFAEISDRIKPEEP